MSDESIDKPTGKQDLIRRIQDGRVALDHTMERIGPDRLNSELPGAEWAVRDLLHHISAWERFLVRWLEESLRGETPDRPAPDEEWEDLDRLNAEISAEGRRLSEAEVLTNFVESYHDVVETVKHMSEEDLFDGDRFVWRKGVPIWTLIAANTWEHYAEHADQITTLISPAE